MQLSRVLVRVGVASVCLSDHLLAMGSGPHPNVPYGLPAPAPHPVTASSPPSLFLIFGVVAVVAIIVLVALMTIAESRQPRRSR